MSSVSTVLAFVFTVLASISIVAVIILLGWFLIWKAFLSKFRLVRELLGNGDELPPPPPQPPAQAAAGTDNNQGDRSAQARVKKLRRD